MIRWLWDTSRWAEVLNNMGRRPLRTTLSAMGVFWGVFLLVFLLGCGEGFKNGIMNDFKDDAMNSVWFFPGRTSRAWQGLQPGRTMQFTEETFNFMQRSAPHLLASGSPRSMLQGTYSVSYGKINSSFEVLGVTPPYMEAERVLHHSGRMLNETDETERRKVAFIGQGTVKELFGGEDPIGQLILIKGFPYRVVGTFIDEGAENEQGRIYLPFHTYMNNFGNGPYIQAMAYTLQPGLSGEKAKAELRAILARHLQFDPEDSRAAFIWTRDKEYQATLSLFSGIEIFLWVVGAGTLIAGVVGIGNIMLIAVKERTKEIGIRLALGATPAWVIGIILQEALVITLTAGYLGIAAGVGLLEFIRNQGLETAFFNNPEVDLRVAAGAALVLVAAACLAALPPAMRAASVQPIEAMRQD